MINDVTTRNAIINLIDRHRSVFLAVNSTSFVSILREKKRFTFS